MRELECREYERGGYRGGIAGLYERKENAEQESKAESEGKIKSRGASMNDEK